MRDSRQGFVQESRAVYSAPVVKDARGMPWGVPLGSKGIRRRGQERGLVGWEEVSANDEVQEPAGRQLPRQVPPMDLAYMTFGFVPF